MLCQRCRKRNAQFHSSRIIKNQLVDIHLCKRCVENSSNHEYTNNIDTLLEALIKINVYDKSQKNELQCDTCGTTLLEFQKSKLVGCPQCYDVFSEYIFKDKKMSYRRSSGTDKRSDFIKRLEKRLKKAVESEDFEEAAHLRDKIRDLEEGCLSDY